MSVYRLKENAHYVNKDLVPSFIVLNQITSMKSMRYQFQSPKKLQLEFCLRYFTWQRRL